MEYKLWAVAGTVAVAGAGVAVRSWRTPSYHERDTSCYTLNNVGGNKWKKNVGSETPR